MPRELLRERSTKLLREGVTTSIKGLQIRQAVPVIDHSASRENRRFMVYNSALLTSTALVICLVLIQYLAEMAIAGGNKNKRFKK